MNNSEKILNRIRIVLVEPQVPGNVGAAARAMKNMGLSRLVLVRPWFHKHSQSKYMAHASEDILDAAEIFDDLGKAVKDSVLVAGVSRRIRGSTPFQRPREAAVDIMEYANAGDVSVMFGREDRGLFTSELNLCQMIITIPSSEAQPSLNLSQAVMTVAYELFSASGEKRKFHLDYASSEDLEGMYDHLLSSLRTLGLKQWNNGENYMKALRRVFSRTMLEKRDVGTIHKLCGEIDKFSFRLKAELEKEKQE